MEVMINVNGKEIKAVEYAGNMYVNTTCIILIALTVRVIL